MVLAMALTMGLSGTAFATNVWDGESVTAPTTSSDTLIIIDKGSELAWVADQVNDKGNDFAGYTVRLGDDIDLNDEDWTPIGRFFAYGGANKAFRGTFDGAGHSITGLNVVNDDENYSARGETAALFGYIDYADSASSRSAAVSVSETPADRAIADAASLGILEGSANYERVVAERTALYIKFGVSPSAGTTRSVTPSYAIGGKVKNVKVYGSVSNIRGQGAAGVVCWNDGVIENCYFEGTVVCSPNTRAYAGGICSLLGDNDLNHNTYVVNCAVSADVTGTGTNFSYGGGIAGYCYAMNRGYIVNCAVQNGSVYANMDAGGIVGGFAYQVYNDASSCVSVNTPSTVVNPNLDDRNYRGGIIGAYGTPHTCGWVKATDAQPTYAVGGGTITTGRVAAVSSLFAPSFLLPSMPDLAVGDTATISLTSYPAGASTSGVTYTWSSSNTAVATVVGSGASATVTGVGVGAATITATATNSSWTSVSDVAITPETVVNVVSASRAAAMRAASSASASGANGSESGSKSGGCNAGFAALALLALVPCAMVGRKRK